MAGRRGVLGTAWRILEPWLPRDPLRRVVVLALGAYAAFLLALNLSVAFFGDTLVFPLSPFHVRDKLYALGKYFLHRPLCLLTGGHGPMEPAIAAAARRYAIDRALLAAVVHVESGTRPHRISPTGAMGPAQLIGSTARMLGVDDPFDPEAGVDGGARYLRKLLRQFNGDERLAVAAYNAGPGAIVGGRVPRNGETEDYVERVLKRWKETRPQASPPSPPPPAAAPPPEKRAKAPAPTAARAPRSAPALGAATAATVRPAPERTPAAAPAKPRTAP